MDIPMEFERILQAIMNDYRESLNRAYAFEHNRSSLESLTEAKEVQTATLVELRGIRQQVIIADRGPGAIQFRHGHRGCQRAPMDHHVFRARRGWSRTSQ
jgi:hypothetical protein